VCVNNNHPYDVGSNLYKYRKNESGEREEALVLKEVIDLFSKIYDLELLTRGIVDREKIKRSVLSF
jgi:hypothetical protein